MARTLKVGVIGTGIGTYHIEGYLSHPQAEVVALCDVNQIALDLAGAKYCIPHLFTDYRRMLEMQELDAVSVCVPNALHAPLTLAAFAAGKHVLCEKPMATNLADAKKMIAAAKKAGRKLMIGHNQRLMPPHVKARKLIQEGALGKVLSFRTSFGHGGPEMWSQDKGAHTWFFKKEEAFVGTMGDLGVHKADLIRWLLDSEVVEAGAFVDTLAKRNEKGKAISVDDNAVCILRLANGAMGQLTASWTYSAAEDNITVIYGTKGQMVLGANPAFPVEVKLSNGEVAMYKVGGVSTNEAQLPSGIPDAFIDAILDNTDPEISGLEGLKALAIVLACLKSAETKQIVKVEY